MPVCVNNTNPKIKKDLISCSVCNEFKLCIRFENENMCKPCYNKKNIKKIYLWCMYCYICGHLTSEDTKKECSECKKTVGTCCGRLYHCQSTECVCKKCYDYKCNFCNNILPKDKVYVSDADISSDNVSICDTCKQSNINQDD